MSPTAFVDCSRLRMTAMQSHTIGQQRRTFRCRAIERIQGVRDDVDGAVVANLSNCLTATTLQGFGEPTVGKVRDTYDAWKYIVIVTTDRQSAFDRLLANVPFKGQVLNQTSAWWFNHTKDIVPNALVGIPDPCVAIMRKCDVFPVEFVVRGYMTGSTETSLWTHYNAGAREYCGNKFPDGMVKNQRLEKNVLTPTTKGVHKDVPVSADEILEQGLMSQEDWDRASQAALALFSAGQEEAAKRGMLLVDTKYEFGKDSSGNVVVIDEVHTPDSSRYWLADSYQERLAAGMEPQNIDKEFLRIWFRDNCDPYADDVLPDAPDELVAELSRRYIFLYERITGQPFELPVDNSDIGERLQKNVDEWWREHVQG